jgi:hypothetical protein
MPLHHTGLVSRRELDHPEEKPREVPTFEHVLKYNPHHGPDGRFTSGGSKRGHIQGLSKLPVRDWPSLQGPTGGRHIPGLSPLAVRDWPSLQAKGVQRALDASVSGPATPEAAHIRRQAHTSFQTKSGQKHTLNPAKSTFRI